MWENGSSENQVIAEWIWADFSVISIKRCIIKTTKLDRVTSDAGERLSCNPNTDTDEAIIVFIYICTHFSWKERPTDRERPRLWVSIGATSNVKYTAESQSTRVASSGVENGITIGKNELALSGLAKATMKLLINNFVFDSLGHFGSFSIRLLFRLLLRSPNSTHQCTFVPMRYRPPSSAPSLPSSSSFYHHRADFNLCGLSVYLALRIVFMYSSRPSTDEMST